MTDVITQHLDVWTSAISTKSTAGRGTSDKQTAYGIQKLRELILATALRGLFEIKNECLPESIEEDIKKAKDAYYQSINKKSKEYVFGSALLKEFSLPIGWQWKRVGEMCGLQTGATPSTLKPEYFNGTIPWLVSGDINRGIIDDCEGRISEEALANSNCKLLPERTVLIALNGQGKTRASVALLNISAACNQSLVGMIPFDYSILEPRFLLLALKYRYYEIRDITGQNQRRGLNMGLVAELSLPLPPLAEQHRIVAKVDELMALCDQLEQQQTNGIAAHQILVETLLDALTRSADAAEFAAAWQRIAEHFDTLFTTEHSIDQLKQTILQLAVMGKLVPQDAREESATILLKNIANEKDHLIKAGLLKKAKPLPSITDDEMLFPSPTGWAWTKFGMVAEFINGDRSKNYPNRSEYVDDGIPWINTGHIEPDGTLTTQDMNFISREKYDSLNSGKIQKGDLVYCLRGATFGKTAFVEPYDEGAIASSLMIIRPHITGINKYIYLYLISPFGKNQLTRFDNGSAQPNLSASNVMLYACPLPPLAEQHRIVAKVDELMAICDALKAHIADAQTTQIHLADAIVEQAVA